MFPRLLRLTLAVLLAAVAIAASAAMAFSTELPARTTAASVSGPLADLPVRSFDVQRPARISPRSDLRPLAAGDPQTITVEVVPNVLVANSGMTALITATVYDITNDVVEGVILTGAISPTRGAIGSFPATISGTATSTWTATSGSAVGVGTIVVFSDTVSGSAPITLTADEPFTVTLTRNPITLTVGSTSVLTATVVDRYNNPVADGTTVVFTSSLGTPGSPVTTTNGIAISSLSYNMAGTAHVTATSSGRSGYTSIFFAPGLPFSVTLTANPISLTVGNTSVLTATVRDLYGNLVGDNTSVTFASSLGSPPPSGTTINGIVTSSLNSTVAGTAYITATATGGAAASTSVVFAPDSPSSVNLQANPTSLTVGNASTLTATVRDQYGNLVADNTSVTFASSPGTPLSPRTTIDGIANSSLNSTVAGTAYITATSGSGSRSTTVVFNPGAPTTLSLSPFTSVITAGLRITYTAIATDTYGNRIGDVTAGTSFNISPGSGGTFVGNVITPTIKGTYTVTGTNGVSATASLVVTPTTFSRLSIEFTPNDPSDPINAYPMTVYDTLTAYAVGYDVYSNALGSQIANWGSTGVVAGRVSPTIGISTTFTPAVSGTGFITATLGGFTYTTGLITIQAPVLRISTLGNPDPVTPGTPLTYTIKYTNTSTFVAAQGVIITETYPPSTTTTYSNVWSIPSLAAGASGTITVGVNVAKPMPVGSMLTNTVQIGALRTATVSGTAMTRVNAEPSLGLNVSGPSTVRPGDQFDYSITYFNVGTAPASGLRITETYPSQVTFVSADPLPLGGTNNVWVTDTLDVGAARSIVVTVRVNSPVASGTMTNTVVLDSNESLPLTATKQTQVAAPTLQLTKSANPVGPVANSLLTYTLLYTNSGSSYASNVVITDALPSNTTFQSCTFGCSLNGNIVAWNLGTLLQQTSNALTLVVQVNNNLPNGTILTNTARITSTELATVFATLVNTVSSAPNVSLLKSDGVASAAAGEVLTYQLAYTNTGTAPAQNVVITDRIPANVSFVGCTACVAMGSGVYSFTRSTVNAASGGVVTLSIRVNSPLPAGVRAITNTAFIRTATSGDNPADNSAQDVDGISTVPTLALTPLYDGSTPYPGKTITYTLRYTNTSLMDTTGVVISTTRSPYVSAIPTGWSFINGDDIYTVNNLAAGQSGVITYIVVLTSTFTPDMNAFANTFLIRDNGPGGLPPASQSAPTTVGVPDLIIESVQVPAATPPNRPFTATLTIRNIGLGRACNPNLPVCGQTWADAFVAPITLPLSYPFNGYGDSYARVPQIDPGQIATVYITNIVLLVAQQPIVYFKVDNYACPGTTCLPPGSQGGLVPESNEYNNVTGPVLVPRYAVYLPLIRKSRP
jgi:uncharacterized repeat protein (TIGR01451 family)